MTDQEFIERLRRLYALLPHLSLGPWKYDYGNWEIEGPWPERQIICAMYYGDGINQNTADAEFLAECRELVPELLGRIKENK